MVFGYHSEEVAVGDVWSKRSETTSEGRKGRVGFENSAPSLSDLMLCRTRLTVEKAVDDLGSLDDPLKSDDGRMRGGSTMESELPPKELPLSSVETDVVQALDGCQREENKSISLPVPRRVKDRERGGKGKARERERKNEPR